MKKVSVAILYTDGEKFLAVRPTNKGYWELPKGLIDEGESITKTAVREFKEEVGLDLDPLNLEILGKWSFHSLKDVIVCRYEVADLAPLESMVCKSTTKAYGAPVPEISAYKYMSLNIATTHLRSEFWPIMEEINEP